MLSRCISGKNDSSSQMATIVESTATPTGDATLLRLSRPLLDRQRKLFLVALSRCQPHAGEPTLLPGSTSMEVSRLTLHICGDRGMYFLCRLWPLVSRKK